MRIIIIFFLAVLLSTCKKEVILIPDNVPYQNKYISTIQIQNYVNKLYIDLIGREPLNTEMERDVNFLKSDNLSSNFRDSLINKLQTNTDFIEGDTSYQKAYYHRFYDVVKIKMLEGIENDVLNERKGILNNSYQGSVASGDSLQAAIDLKNITEINDILGISENFQNKLIDISDVFKILMDNYAYDEINMNTFNFVNASFSDVFFRLPTTQEYEIAFEMIENNTSGYLFGKTGTSKGEYLDIMTTSNEFYEGIIIWTYKSLLSRNPNAVETSKYLSDLINSKDFQHLQKEIMKTDEYANF